MLRLSLFLAKTNFKLRNEGSYLGIFWYILNPLVLFAVILFIRKTAFAAADTLYYPAYLLIGIAGFNFFRQVISSSIKVIDANAGLIKSISGLSLETFVVSRVIEAVFSHAFELVMIVGLMVYLGAPLAGLVLYPVFFMMFALFTLGLALICATVGVYVNDLENIWLIFSQFLFLATPIFYVVEQGSALHAANLINPLYYFVEISREVMIYRQFPELWMIGVMAVFAAVFLVAGASVFGRYKKRFAELV